ncbi:ABC transporter permease [bacterium]|nr:ABC transporter permease [bacterium]
MNRFSGRILAYGLSLFVALTINFALPRLAPGDPAYFLLGRAVSELTDAERAKLLSEVGLDRPILEQYGRYLAGIVTGDWGISLRFGKPVTAILAERVPWTLLLGGSALIVSVLLGMTLGVFAAWKRGQKEDIGILSFVMLLDSMPAFWVAMMLIGVFSVTLGLLPAFGAVPIGAAGGMSQVIEVVRRLILPVATLTVTHVGSVFLITRYSMVTALREDYIVMAEAKGVGERGVVFRHALRNALLPIYTSITVMLGTLLGGNVVVETVFAYPGVGRLIYESILARDYAVMQGAFLLIVFLVLAANLMADLAYPLIDPRVRRQGVKE